MPLVPFHYTRGISNFPVAWELTGDNGSAEERTPGEKKKKGKAAWNTKGKEVGGDGAKWGRTVVRVWSIIISRPMMHIAYFRPISKNNLQIAPISAEFIHFLLFSFIYIVCLVYFLLLLPILTTMHL